MTTPKKPGGAAVVLRIPEVLGYCGLSVTTFRELVDSGDLPQPIRISEHGRALAWLRSELDAWLASRVAARDQAPRDQAAKREATLKAKREREQAAKAAKPKKRKLRARRAAPAAGARA
jgi:prophage regulatory protein